MARRLFHGAPPARFTASRNSSLLWTHPRSRAFWFLWCLRRVPLFEAAILEARRGEVELFSLSSGLQPKSRAGDH